MLSNVVAYICIAASGIGSILLINRAAPRTAKLSPQTIWMFLLITLAGFATNQYLIFLLVTSLILITLIPQDPVSKVAIAVFLMLAVPTMANPVELGGIVLMQMSWSRLVTIIILLPIILKPKQTPTDGTQRSGNSFDKYIWIFFILNAALLFRGESVTANVKGTFQLFLDVIVLYLAISRTITNDEDLLRVLFAALAALVFAAVVCVIEVLLQWHVYEAMVDMVGVRPAYSYRAGFSRASGPFGRPPQAGFAAATGLGLLWAVSSKIKRNGVRRLLSLILIGGLISPFTRGAWLGGLFIGVAAAFNSHAGKVVRSLAIFSILAIPILFATDLGEGLTNLVSGEDEAAARTVEFRNSLLDATLEAAADNPFLGHPDYMENPALQAIAQHQFGFIDIVNHYALVLLETGYIGLTIFICIFVKALIILRRVIGGKLENLDVDSSMARAIAYTLLAMLIIIGTESAVGGASILLWTLVGFTGSYANRGSMDTQTTGN